MKTDHALSELFDKDPDLIKLFVREPDSCSYSMGSMTIKEIERRLDACFIPDDLSRPIIAAEFQGYPDECIYYRWISGACLLGMRNPGRTVYCLLVFLDESLDPKTEPWSGMARSNLPGLEVATFSQVLDSLRETQPDHPIVALISLLLEDNHETIRSKMRDELDLIEHAEMSDGLRGTYAKIYLYWLASKLGGLSLQEVEKMLVTKTPFEETQLYKDILEKARPRIEQEKAEAKLLERISLLKQLRGEGAISEAVFREKVAPIRKALEDTRSSGRNGQ